MQKIYVCDTCGEHYKNDKDALRCEVQHRIAKERAERECANQEKMLVAISDAVNLYIQKYGEFPSIELSDESARVLNSEDCDFSEEIIESLFIEDEED